MEIKLDHNEVIVLQSIRKQGSDTTYHLPFGNEIDNLIQIQAVYLLRKRGEAGGFTFVISDFGRDLLNKHLPYRASLDPHWSRPEQSRKYNRTKVKA